ncbi:MAG: sugar kinase [Microbacterium sp. SCN 70-200]|uniref:FGGY-family carbohydrate kinase n=1 Tax=unclassified Microbacterium TaxID=2609290 RepID=UPI0008691764|nr:MULTISPECIES: FGGY-family carbohydrate kinase [unclassified Microbacterium]MBN9214929.1 FGGY-family carbohydrate kinase [Microbacterium sp.]ODT42971.1 MAG: sugar kinase [Microbacterium sp. SCN 70-200]OJV84723.1 MAG: sugar kinase [Microbacterium sp. 70-16]
MTTRCTLAVDIGTSSSKGVLVDPHGVLLATATIAHDVRRPNPGWVEMDGRLWWDEFVDLSRRLLAEAVRHDPVVVAVGVSGMGPCVLLVDEAGEPVRPAILYGVDTRATEQVERMTASLGVREITRVAGSTLTSQAAGPKIVWTAENEPEAYARARRLFMPASWLAFQLTGAYVLDHQSASQCTPLYDVERESWHLPWWDRFAAGLEPPALRWAGEIAGTVTAGASAATGIPVGTPVIAGTIDAWTEAVSVGAHGLGDLMLMYGTTMFLIATGAQTLRTPSMWMTVGAFPGTRNLAGGLATSGALTAWLKDLTASDYPSLLTEAESSGPGARGLLMLPYLSGERTPILDPDARGVLAGLTLSHTRGDLYRAALEATAFGVRHNVETMRAAGAQIDRIVAVGGGTQGRLWLQIVSDVTGLVQQVPSTTIGASYGAAFLAAGAVSEGSPPLIEEWNPVETVIEPEPSRSARYDELYDLYLRLYPATRDIAHALARSQRTPEETP